MGKEPPESNKANMLELRINMLEKSISSLFEILLQAGIISETSRKPPVSRKDAPPAAKAGKTPVKKSPRYRPKSARDEDRRSIEFLMHSLGLTIKKSEEG